MKVSRTVIIAAVVSLLVLSVACPKKEEDRAITITMKNLGEFAINIRLEGQLFSDANYIPPGESKTTSFMAKSVGHSVSLYVGRDDVTIFTTNCMLGQTGWDNRAAEVHWTGESPICCLNCVNW